MNFKTADMVFNFGTNSIKEKYRIKNELSGSMKKTLINRARMEYEIVEDLGRGNFKLDNPRKLFYSLDLEDKLNIDVYKYIVYSILTSCKKCHDDGNVFTLPVIKYYDEYNMINGHNYNKVYSMKNKISNEMSINPLTTTEFLDAVNKSLRYYLEQSLISMAGSNLINWRKILYVKKFNLSANFISDGIQSYSKEHLEGVPATKIDWQLDTDIKTMLKKKYNINSDEAIWKNSEFIKDYKDELKKNGILYFYNAYEVIVKSKENIEKLIEKLELNESLVDIGVKFSDSFIDLTMENANTKHIKAIENNKIDLHRFGEDYLKEYSTLSQVILNPLYKKIETKEELSCKIVYLKDGGYSTIIEKSE